MITATCVQARSTRIFKKTFRNHVHVGESDEKRALVRGYLFMGERCVGLPAHQVAVIKF